MKSLFYPSVSPRGIQFAPRCDGHRTRAERSIISHCRAARIQCRSAGISICAIEREGRSAVYGQAPAAGKYSAKFEGFSSAWIVHESSARHSA